MTKEAAFTHEIPDSPGVYFFLGKRKEILYIGKATSLRSRVRSYFMDDLRTKRSPLIEKMVVDATSIDWTVTDSVLEALILEANLVKTHKPHCNTDLKDDKSFNHLVITNEYFPRILVVRGKDLAMRFREDEISSVFGPFTSGMLFREAIKITKKIFKYYDTTKPIDRMTTKMAKGTVDFNRQIGLFPTEENRTSYLRTVRHVKLFFEGRKKDIIVELERDMKRLAKEMRFEEAGIIKRRIFALRHIEDVSLIREDLREYRDHRRIRVEAYDVAHLSGKQMVGVMTVVDGYEPDRAEYRKFIIRTVTGANDPAALREILERRLEHTEWPLPQLIVVDGNAVQRRAAESVLEKAGVMIPVVAVVKDEHHRPKRLLGARKTISDHERAILLANSEAHRFSLSFHRDRRSKASLGKLKQ